MAEFLKLPGIDRSLIARVVAVYFLLTGVVGLCAGLAGLLGGVLGGVGAAVLGSPDGLEVINQGIEAAATAGTLSETDMATLEAGRAEFNAAVEDVGGLAGVSVLLLCFGALSVILGPLSIGVAVGLFTRQRWARMGTVVIAVLSVVTNLLGTFGNQGIGNLLWVLFGLFVAWFFYNDEEMKVHLGGA